ncbi:LPP20 family lipoprotein [Paragemmobacter ruber]|uniref:Lipoprotein LPP20-like domain-containing protein n=1 Tax=Paragemmobacter ruber TaxID=1985673 RepID=A0ABW9Y9A2_9RHOB|nr:LPP20 family lipoprotein [Rhodobacter ruber]NBE09166.1 hypothetical protein [Rhodobacter ruber]
MRLADALLISLILGVLLGACTPTTPETASDALPLSATAQTVQLAEVKDNLDAADRMGAPPAPATMASDEARPLKGLGFAQISGQPGKTTNEKRLMAIRAARMDALRDLTEQVHGIRINATTTIHAAVVRDDSLAAVVQGTLRGARTVRVAPSGSDSYEVEMVLDRETVAYIVRALKGRV